MVFLGRAATVRHSPGGRHAGGALGGSLGAQLPGRNRHRAGAYLSRIRIETVINRTVFDGTTADPMQQAIRDSLLAFMAAMAQSQAEIIKEAQKAGTAHALAHDDGTRYRGRKPTFTCQQFVRVRELLNQGIGSFPLSRRPSA